LLKLDHLALKVADIGRAQAWYTSVLGLTVEFESTDPPVVGVKDESDFTLILTESRDAVSDCSLFFQVADVAVTHQGLASRGVEFRYGPQGNDWGYGAGLTDPDGRLVGLWDEASMQAHTSKQA
jgi:catechol 2,3-dioxygenase-like lactoylglutathione lyase family enzyme